MGPSASSYFGSKLSRRGFGMAQCAYAHSNKNDSILVLVNKAQITGKACSSMWQLPKAVLSRLHSSSQSIASLCMDLESCLAANNAEGCAWLLNALSHLICELGNNEHQPGREAFVLCGGDTLLLRVLFCPFASGAASSPTLASVVWLLHKDCLNILRELCYTVPFFTESLANNTDFLIKLFSMMTSITTFDIAIALAEEVLALREDTFNISKIPDFATLVHSFSLRQLESFCHVLAMVVFEPEQNHGQRNSYQLSEVEGLDYTVADTNHEVILKTPDILPRLVKLLQHSRVPSSQEVNSLREYYGSAMDPNTVSDTGNALRERHVGVLRRQVTLGNISVNMVDAIDSEPRGESMLWLEQPTTSTEFLFWSDHQESQHLGTFVDRMRTWAGVGSLTMHQVEVLFVLSALCGGKKREQVQNHLAELGMVEVLTIMFDKLDWKPSESHVKPSGIHGPGCACNPRSALKIQYLRLIHNFCDRDSCNKANKELLLKPASISMRKESSDQRNDESLIIKIIKVLLLEPADSIYRFWLASCVEAFLRGADAEDQEYLASTGLMEHLLDQILKGGFSCAASLQINFDLLGELIKFNKALFSRLNVLLAGERFHQFVEVLVTNLVDSNVFIRSVVLSLEYFKSCRRGLPFDGTSSIEKLTAPSTMVYGQDDCCKITALVAHNATQLLCDLMRAVHTGDVNQDNICVLNTALIMFILAERNGQLSFYLQALRAAEMGSGAQTVSVTQNFRALLDFWKGYYLKKRGQDCISLEYSTTIPFAEWLRTVEILCGGPESPSSLVYSPNL